MTDLRRRFIDAMELGHLSQATQRNYVWHVERYARHYHRCPSQLGEEDVRRWLLEMINRGSSRSYVAQARSALRILYERVLGRSYGVFDHVKERRGRPLPVILTGRQVGGILGLVHAPRCRAALTVVAHCGLRVGEVVRLEVRDIASDERMQLVVRGGKGRKDRRVPLAPCTLEVLRRWWVEHRNPVWIFPAGQSGEAMSGADGPMHARTLQDAFRRATAQSSAAALRPTVHCLRHFWATSMLDRKVPLTMVQRWLGHSDIATTAIYSHVTTDGMDQGRSAVERVFAVLP